MLGLPRYAHRGVHFGVEDENTLVAFRRACFLDDWDGFECDVQLTRDGEVVALHDKSLERTHGIHVDVSDIDSTFAMELTLPSAEMIVDIGARGKKTIVFDLKADPMMCIQKIDQMCAHRDCKRVYLVWEEVDYVRAPNVTLLYACDYVFDADHDTDGVAAKYNGSVQNRESVLRTVSAGKHVNLYAPDSQSLEDMLNFVSSAALIPYADQLSLTLKVGHRLDRSNDELLRQQSRHSHWLSAGRRIAW